MEIKGYPCGLCGGFLSYGKVYKSTVFRTKCRLSNVLHMTAVCAGCKFVADETASCTKCGASIAESCSIRANDSSEHCVLFCSSECVRNTPLPSCIDIIGLCFECDSLLICFRYL